MSKRNVHLLYEVGQDSAVARARKYVLVACAWSHKDTVTWPKTPALTLFGVQKLLRGGFRDRAQAAVPGQGTVQGIRLTSFQIFQGGYRSPSSCSKTAQYPDVSVNAMFYCSSFVQARSFPERIFQRGRSPRTYKHSWFILVPPTKSMFRMLPLCLDRTQCAKPEPQEQSLQKLKAVKAPVTGWLE